MTQPLIEKPDFDPAGAFREMVKAIEHNKDQPCGGAVVIVPPQGGGDPIAFMTIGAADLAQFYGNITSRVQIVLQGLQDKQSLASGFGR